MSRHVGLRIAVSILVLAAFAELLPAAEPPTDNPVASYYSGDEGYPAWTERIRWSNVIDMAQYPRGRTNFERFENARDELAAQGGGVLYYPAGTYDFSAGPFDGPEGRGLMLRRGVVIRGQSPPGKPKATGGRMELPTKFVFGFKPRTAAIDAGPRLTLELDGADLRVQRIKPKRTNRNEPPPPVEIRYEPAPLILSFAAPGGKIGGQVKGFRRGYGRDVWPGRASVQQSGDAIRLSVTLTIDDPQEPGEASYEIALQQDGKQLTGNYRGRCRDQQAAGTATGRLLTITPETPRDWNFIGQMPEPGQRLKDIDRVGVCWVHLVGGTIYFGPDLEWGATWATADSWKSPYVKPAWARRKPDGTHPWDPFAGGGSRFVGAGDGRLVFGCVLEHAAVLNESITMGRPDDPQGFGPDGFYLYKFGPRVGVYGSRVFLANNLLPISRGRNFKYQQTTRRTFPMGGAGMGFDPPRSSIVLFDYNKTCGFDVNKCLLGLTKESIVDQTGAGGYFLPLVAIVDNCVYNHGHKGFNVSGTWVTIAGNRNQRQMLREGYDPERIGGWELTLDGHLESSPGGNGAISDNLSRAFDLSGRSVWVHQNGYNNTGSSPGNDGEGILCQAHGGSQIFSWAITYNEHDKGDGQSGYIGGWDVNIAGALFGWNKTGGWIGAANVGRRDAEDVAFVGNQAAEGEKPMRGAQLGDAPGRLQPPVDVKAEIEQGDTVRITWRDASANEAGFRVERQIALGVWTAIAYRPPQITGHSDNAPAWVDFLAPPGKALRYRVVAIDSKDDDRGASEPTETLQIPTQELGNDGTRGGGR